MNNTEKFFGSAGSAPWIDSFSEDIFLIWRTDGVKTNTVTLFPGLLD